MPAPDYPTLYRFEELLSATLEALFNSAQLKAIGASEASDDMQKDRPRVEVFVHVGSRFSDHYVISADGLRRENGWHGYFSLNCITATDVSIHSDYLAAVRELVSRLDQLDLSNSAVANPPLQYHEIAQVHTAGTNSKIEPQTGNYETMLTYDIIFAIRADAWPGGLQLQPTN